MLLDCYYYCTKAGSVTDPDYGAPFPKAEEGDPGMSAGRPRGTLHIYDHCLFLI